MATMKTKNVTKLIHRLYRLSPIVSTSNVNNIALKKTIAELHRESIKTPNYMHSIFLFKNRQDIIYSDTANNLTKLFAVSL